jgi:3-oxoadipate enol-lactonase
MISRTIKVRSGQSVLSARIDGRENGPAIVLSHSILASNVMWEAQSRWLAEQGYFVISIDTRGHGDSTAPNLAFGMDELVGDIITVLDQLDLDAVHFVGLSLGGMIGFGLGIHHPERLRSLMICAARADAPPAFVAPWPERIALAQSSGCGALARPTIERWFGLPFLDANPGIARHFERMISGTSTEGFVGCAQALMELRYLPEIHRIEVPTTLVAGAKDGPIPEAMREAHRLIAGSVYLVIENAGHLPNVDQPVAFQTVMQQHLNRTRIFSGAH